MYMYFIYDVHAQCRLYVMCVRIHTRTCVCVCIGAHVRVHVCVFAFDYFSQLTLTA